ncbi:MAG: hypothetical protein EBR09_12300 [Proteobacteria bacterium]|nr:hypothetical protein [Pseudomonadota bacterium]
MTGAWLERARGQIDRPLLRRHPLILILSVFAAFPLSLLWSFAATLRALKRHKLSPLQTNDPMRIISVGNVSAGGTGKSPVVRAFARQAFAAGHDVAVLARGYGNAAASKRDIVVSISAADSSAETDFWNVTLSDEGLEHALLLKDFITSGNTLFIAQGANRRILLDKVMELRKQTGGAESKTLVVLLDDGLSQTSLPVHHDVVLWDPHLLMTAPRVCLPFGPYRMGWPWKLWPATIPAADLLVWSRLCVNQNKDEFDGAVHRARLILQKFQTENELFAVEKAKLAKVVSLDDNGRFRLENCSAAELKQEFFVLTGLARPQRYLQTLAGLGAHYGIGELRPARVIHLSDHAQLDDSARLHLSGNEILLTSLKDLCRWRHEPAVIGKIKQNKVYLMCLDVELKGPEGGRTVPDLGAMFPCLKEEGTMK